MVLSWLTRSRRSTSVDDLVARRQYEKAVEAFREEFDGRQPTPAERLRMADLLVLAGRGEDAMPILFGIADEQARFGFIDKALEALRRASEVEPGRPDIGRRIHKLRETAARSRSTKAATAGSLSADPGADAEWTPPASGPVSASPETPPVSLDPSLEADAPELPELNLDEPEPPLTEAQPGGDESELQLLEDDPVGDLPELHPIEQEPTEEPRPLLTEAELDAYEPVLRTRSSGRRRNKAPTRHDHTEKELHEFLLALGRLPGHRRRALGATLFADFPREQLQHVAHGLRPQLFSPGDVIVPEGDHGNSLFLIASGSVRVLIMGGHGQPFDIRRLETGDFFGEVAVLSNRPRTATVVAATPCKALEIERTALESLMKMRPGARALLEEVCASRARCQEEEAVRSLPPEAADPERAAAALRAHFGSSDWSPRVRTYLARLMLDAGRQDEALAILASVAQDLARRGRAQKAITLLKTVETIQRRGIHAIELAPLRPGRRRSARHAGSADHTSGSSAPTSRAAKEAAFREWVGLLIRATDELAARSAPRSSTVERDRADPDLTQVSAHATAQRIRQEVERDSRQPDRVG